MYVLYTRKMHASLHFKLPCSTKNTNLAVLLYTLGYLVPTLGYLVVPCAYLAVPCAPCGVSATPLKCFQKNCCASEVFDETRQQTKFTITPSSIDPLRKHVYAIYFNSNCSTNDNFQMKKKRYLSYFCSKRRLWVHVRTAHNLCFRAKIRKNEYPCKPQINYTKVGVRGVYITRTCWHDAFEFVSFPFLYLLRLSSQVRMVYSIKALENLFKINDNNNINEKRRKKHTKTNKQRQRLIQRNRAKVCAFYIRNKNLQVFGFHT